MKITVKKIRTCKFANLKVNDYFIYHSMIYIKIREEILHFRKKVNAVNIETGALIFIADLNVVKPIKIKEIIAEERT